MTYIYCVEWDVKPYSTQLNEWLVLWLWFCCWPVAGTWNYWKAKSYIHVWWTILALAFHFHQLQTVMWQRYISFISSAGWAYHISWSNVRMCLDVNQGGTNRYCCTQRLVILRAPTY